jgi:hypothetical protein
MKHIDLHPEHLIDRERRGTLDPTGRASLAVHRADCASCAVEHRVTRDFADVLAPTDADRALAASLVAAMFDGEVTPEAPAPAPTAPSKRGRPPALALGVTASILAHVAAAAFVLLLPTAARRAMPTPASLGLTELELAVAPSDPPATSSEGRPGTPGAAPVVPSATVASGAVRRRAGRAEVPTVGASELPAVGASELPTVGAVEPVVALPTRAVDPTRLALLIDPSHVARGGFVVDGAPSQRGAPAGLELDSRPAPSARELGMRLGQELRAEAQTKAHTTRTRPVLRRQPDGSHRYDGARFAALVRPDGSVEFLDRPGVATNGFSASGTFDATEALMGAAGQDPLRVEREWFMEHTEPLRDRLEREYRARELENALRTLRGRLLRVWATESRSPAARRRRLFRIWDEASDDDAGQTARRIVLDFIREVLPPGSEHAYTPQELQRLNATRETPEPFAPY